MHTRFSGIFSIVRENKKRKKNKTTLMISSVTYIMYVTHELSRILYDSIRAEKKKLNDPGINIH